MDHAKVGLIYMSILLGINRLGISRDHNSMPTRGTYLDFSEQFQINKTKPRVLMCIMKWWINSQSDRNGGSLLNSIKCH